MTPIPEAWLIGIHAHAAAMRANRGRLEAASAGARREQWSAFHESIGAWGWALYLTVPLSATILMTLIVEYAPGGERLKAHFGLAVWITAGATVGAILAIKALRFVRSRARDVAWIAPTQAARCGRCGGSVVVIEAQAAVRCVACKSVSLANDAVRGRILARAEGMALEAECAQAFVEREACRVRARRAKWTSPVPNVLALLVGVSLTLLPLLLGVTEIVASDGARGWGASNFGAVTTTLGAVAWIVCYVLIARPRGRSIFAGRIAAKRLGATVNAEGVEPALDWLDSAWGGRAPADLIEDREESLRLTLRARIGGRPVMLVYLFLGSHVANELTILVAAASPSLVREEGLSRELADLALRVDLSSHGLVLTRRELTSEMADPAWIERALHVAASCATLS